MGGGGGGGGSQPIGIRREGRREGGMECERGLSNTTTDILVSSFSQTVR